MKFGTVMVAPVNLRVDLIDHSKMKRDRKG